MRSIAGYGLWIYASCVFAQTPFTADVSFSPNFLRASVSDIEFLDDNKILVGGWVEYVSPNYKALVRILPNGNPDNSFDDVGGYGGWLTPWNGMYYMANQYNAVRVFENGGIDQSFAIEPSNFPFFSSLQGAQYVVDQDGKVLLTGLHTLFNADTNSLGDFGLVRVTNTGRLDSTFTHRHADNVVLYVQPTDSGRLYLSGLQSTFDGQPVGRILRVLADGSLDPSFNTTIINGAARAMLPQLDGKLIAGGSFVLENEADTLHLIRLMPNGDLDTTFFNHLDIVGRGGPVSDLVAPINDIEQLPDGRMIIVGNFFAIDEQHRGAIAIVDPLGHLLNDYFTGIGCDTAEGIAGTLSAGLAGIEPAPDGGYYIYGTFQDYDGIAGQKYIVRLHGLDVGVDDPDNTIGPPLRAYPNPVTGPVCITSEPGRAFAGTFVLINSSGQVVQRFAAKGMNVELDLSGYAPGPYLLRYDDPNGAYCTVGIINRSP